MKQIVYRLLTRIFCLLPVCRRKILFMSYYGAQYGCNPKYLSQYITEHCNDWTVVWAFTNPETYSIEGIKKVRYLSLRYFFELSTSQVFVTNYRMPDHYRKRKWQLYIQTWHSSLRLKMIEGDTESTLPPHYVKMAKRDSKQTDALLSGCQYSTDVFKRAFWYDGPIVPTGTPREDLMFSHAPGLREKIMERLGCSRQKKIVLYAPTFRKNKSLDCCNIDFNRLVGVLSAKFGGEWVVVLRLHPHLQTQSKQLLEGYENIIDATRYDDIQELLYVADMVISDYSSLVFDFALTLRPCLLYTPDLDEYVKNDRHLYFSIESLPFPISHDNDELDCCITEFDEHIYRSRILAFNNSIGTFETGHACENVMKYIIEKTRYE